MSVLLERSGKGHDDPLTLIKITLAAVNIRFLVMSWSSRAELVHVKNHALAHNTQQRIGVRDGGQECLGLVITSAHLRWNL